MRTAPADCPDCARAQPSAGLERHGLDPDGLADGRVGELAGVGVEAEREAGVVAAGLLPALVGQRDGVRHGRVGQRVGRGVRHRARHVRHAVEDRVVDLVGRVGVRGGVGVLEAAALVDGDVDQHRARLHPRDQLVGDQLGRGRARDQHRADHHVGLHHLLLDGQPRRGEAVDAVVVAPERHPQLVEVGVEQGDVGAHAERDVGGVLAGDAGADDDDLGVGDAADAAHQHAATALGLHQRVGADLRCQAAGDLGHRVEQRQPAGRQLHGLVGDAGDLAVDQLLGQRLVGREVQVGEQRQPLAHPGVLLGDRLLDLEDHVDAAVGAPGVLGRGHDRGAGADVLVVVDGGPDPRILLDEHLVAVADQLVHADGRDGHAVLVVLDFLGDSDLHVSTPRQGPVVAARGQDCSAGGRTLSGRDDCSEGRGLGSARGRVPPHRRGRPGSGRQRRHPAPLGGQRHRRVRAPGQPAGAARRQAGRPDRLGQRARQDLERPQPLPRRSWSASPATG